MGWLNAIDKLANAGAGSRMPEEKLTRAKSQGQTTNHRNQLAQVANGFGVSRAAQRAAKDQLVKEVGAVEADRLTKEAARKVRTSFSGR